MLGHHKSLGQRSCRLIASVVCACVKPYTQVPLRRIPLRAAPSGVGRQQTCAGRRRMGWVRGGLIKARIWAESCRASLAHALTTVLSARPSCWGAPGLDMALASGVWPGFYPKSMFPHWEVGRCSAGGRTSAGMRGIACDSVRERSCFAPPLHHPSLRQQCSLTTWGSQLSVERHTHTHGQRSSAH